MAKFVSVKALTVMTKFFEADVPEGDNAIDESRAVDRAVVLSLTSNE